MRHRTHLRPGDAGLAARLRREIEGEVWFDPASRGRYSTDASIYQIEPIGVVAPRSAEDIARTIAICREAGAPVLPRGAGTSQCGQTVGEAVVVDTSKHLDAGARRRRRGAPRRGAAGGGARPPQRVAQAPGALLPRRRLARQPGHHRRHGRQQLVRRALHPLREHGAQRACDQRRFSRTGTRCASARSRATSRGSPATTTTPTSSTACVRLGPVKPTRSRAAFRPCSGGSAATTSTP